MPRSAENDLKLPQGTVDEVEMTEEDEERFTKDTSRDMLLLSLSFSLRPNGLFIPFVSCQRKSLLTR